MIFFLVALAVVLSVWALGASQASWRLSNETRELIGRTTEEFDSDGSVDASGPLSVAPCAACQRTVPSETLSRLDLDLPIAGPESKAVLPITLQICEDCVNIGA